jgi:hypothetical protein
VLELAEAGPVRARKGSRLVAEQLRFDHRLRQRRHVDRDEGLVAALGEVVHRPGGKLLAGAGSAGDQHIRVGAGDRTELLAQGHHGGRTPDQHGLQRIAVLQFRPQRPVFDRQPAHLQCARHHIRQALRVEGFLDEIMGAGAHGLDSQRHIAMTCDQDHRQFRVALAGGAQQFQPVHHRHADVRDDDPAEIPSQPLQRAVCAGEGSDAVALQLKRLGDCEANILLVIDQDNFARAHSAASTPVATVRRSVTVKRAPPSGRFSARIVPSKSRMML